MLPRLSHLSSTAPLSCGQLLGTTSCISWCQGSCWSSETAVWTGYRQTPQGTLVLPPSVCRRHGIAWDGGRGSLKPQGEMSSSKERRLPPPTAVTGHGWAQLHPSWAPSHPSLAPRPKVVLPRHSPSWRNINALGSRPYHCDITEPAQP